MTLLLRRHSRDVRELDNVARRYCLLWTSGMRVPTERHLLEECLGMREQRVERSRDLRSTAGQAEKAMLQGLVNRWSRQELGRVLGIDRSMLWRKLKRHGMAGNRN